MPAINSISADKLLKLIGTPGAPSIIDVRPPEDFAADPRLVPGALRRDFATVADWAPAFAGQRAVVLCHRGHKLSEGVAAWLRHAGVDAELLDGGASAWAAAGHPMVPEATLPPRDAQGRTLWVTRARPKVDRIACPWLIRRFVDPNAVFLFVTPAEVPGVAERFGATPFDVEGVRWNGPVRYFKSWIPEAPPALLFLIVPLEILGQFMRLISLSVRLFANMLAGHILILTFLGLIFIYESLALVPMLIPATLFYLFEVVIVVGIQAFIFAALSAIYIGSAIEPEH